MSTTTPSPFLSKLGFALFITGFAIFNISFFLGSYELSQETVKQNLPESVQTAFIEEAKNIIDKPIGSPFGFVSEVGATIAAINEKALQKYSLSSSAIDVLANAPGAFPVKFDLPAALEKLTGEPSVIAYQKKAFNDYGGWLNGREYQSADQLKNDISNVATNIEKYDIIQKFGLDRYQADYQKYALAKAANQGPVTQSPVLFLLLTYGLCIIGAFLYFTPKKDLQPGIKHNGIFQSAMKNKGWLGIMTGTYLIAFYIFLYFMPEYMTTWIVMVDPVSMFLKGSPAGEFFLYGFLYTLCILVMGVRMLLKYRHSNYQIFRTISVMFFQTAFAFLIPEILLRLNQPYFDFKNIWPLDYDFFFNNELDKLIQNGGLGIFMLGWGIGLVLLGVPIFTYFFGKRWYCSWVCGCGGLAETLGDPYRQLSDKSLKAWKFERFSIHGVLVFAVVMTAAVLYTYFTGQAEVAGVSSYKIREVYGAWIGAGFSGVVGTGFYPLMGNRVWCRFGCPLAAYLGLVQRFKSRFRITTNGGQCISCGNCSTYCEMGIDVRWYAQRGQNIVRSSCVGCGVCSSVCPRGVLNLEANGEDRKLNEPLLIGNETIGLKA